MNRSTEISVKVPFHDCDPVGVVWHGHYAKYCEVARCALLDTFNYNYTQMAASGYAWPIIDMWLRYVQPAVFGQQIRVAATLVEWEHRLKIHYLIRDADSGERICKGHSIQVAVDMATNEMCLMSPDVLFERLGLSVET